MRARIVTLLLIIILICSTPLFAGGNRESDADDGTTEATPTETEPGQDDEEPQNEAEETPPPSDEDAVQPAPSGTPLGGDPARYAATVNGVGILRTDLERTIDQVVGSYAASGQIVPESQMAELTSQILDQLIAQELLIQEAVVLEIEYTELQAEADYQDIRSQVPADADWAVVLQNNNTTDEELRDSLHRTGILQQMLAIATEGVAPATEDEIEQFYLDNPEYFQTGETVTARHILISTDGLTDEAEITEACARAEEIREELLAGADFALLAIERSEGPSATQGGNLGTFGRGQMVAPFEEAAFALEVDAISEVVQTQFGFHVIQVTDKTEAGLIELADVSASIGQYVGQLKQEEALNAYVNELREVAEVIIFDNEVAD
jgi:peptidyl-prolyl cis-trans isomerase C